MKKTIGMILIAFLLCMMLPMTAFADEGDTQSGDTPVIQPVESSDAYKGRLMDAFDKTLLGKNESLRNQISKILYMDEITVTRDNYDNIIRAVNETIEKQTLSDGAALDHYTDEDFTIAAELIKKICDELGLDYSIDPSNDSQNEYARVITIRKDGKVLGQINSDTKTDVANSPKIGWIIGGGVLIAAAAVFGVILVIRTSRKKKEAA
jgi:hypothetical protein